MNKRIPQLFLTISFFAISLSINAQWGNPLVYYNFNETSSTTVTDLSGNGFDATADCSTCWDTDGKFDGAFHFTTAERIDMPAGDIAMTNEEGTVAFWVLLPESSAEKINCIWWAGVNSGDMFGPHSEMHICTEAGLNDQYWNHSEVAFVIYDSLAEGDYFIYSDPWKGDVAATAPSEKAISIADNSWHHVACTWEKGGTIALYIDNVTIWDSMAYNPNIWNCNLMTLGVANQRTNRKLNGYLDEFCLYDVALEASDIQNIYSYDPSYDTLSHDASLSDLKVGGETIDGFSSATYTYSYTVDNSVTTPPSVTATKNDANAQDPEIVDATTIPDTATITVVAEDGTTELVYSVCFAYSSSMNEKSIEELEFYPNPAKNTISFKNNLNIEAIEVYGLTGKLLIGKQVAMANIITEIDISNLSSGFYFIKAFTKEGLTAVGKFTKE